MALSRSLIVRNKIIKTQFGDLLCRIKDTSNYFAITSKITSCQNTLKRIKKITNSELIANFIGCKPIIVEAGFIKNPHIRDIDRNQLYQSFSLFKAFNFKSEDLINCIEIFGTHPLTLKNRYLILEEAGIDQSKLTPSMVYRYMTMAVRKIKYFKVDGLMEDVDVIKTYASNIGMPVSFHPPSVSDDTTFKEVKNLMTKAFLSWQLDLSSSEAENSIRIYKQLKGKSFRLMKESLHILRKEIGFTDEKIRSNVFLLYTDPDNAREILKMDTLGGIDKIKVLKMNPKILVYPKDNLTKIHNVLKKYKMPEIALSKVLDVYTLSPDTVEERLKLLHSLPQFSIFCHHPSILKLLLYQKKATSRIQILEDLKLKCASLNILAADKLVFKKYTQEGLDRTRGDDTVFFLIKELFIEGKTIRAKLNRHPYWYHVPVMSIKDTLQYLFSKKFTTEEISNNIQILLYPKSLVEQELSKLENKSDLESCKTSEGELRRETILPLVLYYIEFPHHFSGGGIWTSQPVLQ